MCLVVRAKHPKYFSKLEKITPLPSGMKEKVPENLAAVTLSRSERKMKTIVL